MDGDLLVNRDGVRIVSQSEVDVVRLIIHISVSGSFVFVSSNVRGLCGRFYFVTFDS